MVINMDIARSLRPLTIDVLTSTFGLTEGDLSNSRYHWVLLKITQSAFFCCEDARLRKSFDHDFFGISRMRQPCSV